MILNDGNQIRKSEKLFAGFLLIIFSALPVFFIIGLWPDQMPQPKESQVYSFDLFHVNQIKDGVVVTGDTIHLNTIMFLLVALSGFMGSMIHLSSSFTNYIGSGQFKRSWILWYFVKPFTATGVALIFYFVLKAGLLNFDGGGGMNPYGIVILSALAGLFTNKATLKREEIFTTMFKPKDDRPDKIDTAEFSVAGVEPKELTMAGENKILISGTGLDKHPMQIKVDDVEINAEVNNIMITPALISFNYKIDPVQQDKIEIPLTIVDGSGTSLYSTSLRVQEVQVPEEVDAIG